MPARTEAASLSVDFSRWPVVLLRYSGHATDGEWTGHLCEIEQRVLARREPFVHVIDQRRGRPVDPIQRALIVNHQVRMEDRYRRFCRGEVYVAPPEMRPVMAAVFSQARPAYPYAFVDTLDEAMSWAAERLNGGSA